MSQPILYALAAMIGFGVSDFIYKRAAAAAVRPGHLLMAQAWFFCPLVIFYAIAAGALVPEPEALWGVLAGCFVFAGLHFFVRSLAAGPVSTVSSLFRMNFIVTALLAIAFLGEPLTYPKIAGLAFAAIATWFLVGAANAGGAPVGENRRWLRQAALAMVAMGASNYFHAIGLRHGAVPETLVCAQAASFMPLATLAVYLSDRKLQPPSKAYRYGAAAAFVLLAATVSLLRGMALGQASVLVPISQMGFIIAALLGIFVLHERVTLKKAIGLASALAALAMLATLSGGGLAK